MAERIIGHMNNDHHLALVDYVVVYGNEKYNEIINSSVRMTDVNEEKLVLQYKIKSGKDTTLNLFWEKTKDGEGVHVNAISDIRAKLAAMAKYAANKQGFSYKQVTQISPPNSVGSIICYVFAVLSLDTYFQTNYLRLSIEFVSSSNSTKLESLLTLWENKGVNFAVAIYVIHFFEMIFLMWPKVVKYRMPMRTALAWMGFTFIEGIFQTPRFNRLTR